MTEEIKIDDEDRARLKLSYEKIIGMGEEAFISSAIKRLYESLLAGESTDQLGYNLIAVGEIILKMKRRLYTPEEFGEFEASLDLVLKEMFDECTNPNT